MSASQGDIIRAHLASAGELQSMLRRTGKAPDRIQHDIIVSAYEARLAAAEAEADRLRSVLRQTHANYCEAAWTDRGLHAPECLIEHLDDDEPSRPEGEVAGG